MMKAGLGRGAQWLRRRRATTPRRALIVGGLLSSSVILAGFAQSAPPTADAPVAREPQVQPQPELLPQPDVAAPPAPAVQGPFRTGAVPATPAAAVTSFALAPAATDKADKAVLQAKAIPASATASYQRAEAVLKGAMPTCGLEWTLLAAVGEVTTHHARQSYDGPTLGWVLPSLVGPVLTDASGVQEPDSDAGKLDLDARFDRPVGPMYLSPQQWAHVGVDADDDGRRDPHDLDDAALGVAVLLCSDSPKLTDDPARSTALGRLNADPAFATRVLAVAADYRRTAAAVAPPTGPVPTIPQLPLPGASAPEADPWQEKGEAHLAPEGWNAEASPFAPFTGPVPLPWPKGGVTPSDPAEWPGH